MCLFLIQFTHKNENNLFSNFSKAHLWFKSVDWFECQFHIVIQPEIFRSTVKINVRVELSISFLFCVHRIRITIPIQSSGKWTNEQNILIRINCVFPFYFWILRLINVCKRADMMKKSQKIMGNICMISSFDKMENEFAFWCWWKFLLHHDWRRTLIVSIICSMYFVWCMVIISVPIERKTVTGYWICVTISNTFNCIQMFFQFQI